MPKTHLLRSKPPWREGLDFSICGRAAEKCARIIDPGDLDPAARAAAVRCAIWRKDEPPAGLCAVCCDRLRYSATWAADPVAVVAIDTDIYADCRGDALRTELRALAALVAAHPDEFRELLEGESVMLALAGSRSRR